MALLKRTAPDAALLSERLLQWALMAPTVLAAHSRRYWALWLALAGVSAAAVIGLSTGMERLLSAWNNPYSYGHSYLVLPMAAWLFIVGIRGTNIARIGPSVVGFIALVAAVSLYAVAEVLETTLGMQVTLPLILLAAIFALTGPDFARYAVIPSGMLYFTVRIWDRIVGFLQDAATWAVTAWLRWTGIIAHIDGHLITIRAGVLEIAEGCAGLRFVLVSLMLATFFSFAWLRRWRSRLILIAVAGFVSILANWVRIYSLVMIGDWTSMQHYLITESHYAYGWVLFYLFMAPVLWFALWLESREPPGPERRGAPTVRRVAPAFTFLVAGLFAAAVIASPALLRGGPGISAEPHRLALISQPPAGWENAAIATDWRPEFLSPQRVGHEAFISETGVQVDVFIARYLSQQPDSKLVTTMAPLSRGWRSTATRTQEVSLGDEMRQVRSTELVSGSGTRLVLSWYLVGGRPAHEANVARLLQIPALLEGRRDASVIALSAPCDLRCDGAEASIRGLLEAYGQNLEALAAGKATR